MSGCFQHNVIVFLSRKPRTSLSMHTSRLFISPRVLQLRALLRLGNGTPGKAMFAVFVAMRSRRVAQDAVFLAMIVLLCGVHAIMRSTFIASSSG